MKERYIQEKINLNRKALYGRAGTVLVLSLSFFTLLQQRQLAYSQRQSGPPAKLIARLDNPWLDNMQIEWTSPSSAALTVNLSEDQQWHLYDVNVGSQGVTDVKKLNIPTKTYVDPFDSDLCLSPDGQKLIVSPNTRANVHATVKMDGTDYREWDEGYLNYLWNQDSVRWMSVGIDGDSAYFRFHDLRNPSVNPRIKIPLGVQIPFEKGLCYTRDGRFIMSVDPGHSVVSSDTIVTVDFHKQPAKVSYRHIELPEGRILEACISPSGNRVAYILVRRRSDSVPDKVAHALPGRENVSLEVWVGKPGGKAKRVGQIEILPGQGSPYLLRWLPGEKKISYLYFVPNECTNIYTMDL